MKNLPICPSKGVEDFDGNLIDALEWCNAVRSRYPYNPYMTIVHIGITFNNVSGRASVKVHYNIGSAD